MTFIRTSTTFFALIFSVQIAIASGPTLLEGEATSRALVSTSQIKAEESSTASGWWGVSSWIASAQNKVKTLFTVTPRKEPSWQEQWDNIVHHVREKTLNHHKGGFWAANGVAQQILTNPQAEEELKNLNTRLAHEGIDLVEEKELAGQLNLAENLPLLKDIEKLKLGRFATLLYQLSQNEETYPKFVDLLSRFYQQIDEKNKVLKDEPFFKDGALMAQCLWDINKMQRSEKQLAFLKQRVQSFYTDYDHGRLSTLSKRQLDNLGILYFVEADQGLRTTRSSSSFSYRNAATAIGIIFLVTGLGFIQGVAALIPQPAMVTTACRGTAIECLSAFGSPVGFSTQISYFLNSSNIYTITLDDMLNPAPSLAYGDTASDLAGASTYREISNWLNTASPNITRVLNSNGVSGFKGCDYSPLNAAQHSETTYNGIPTSAKSNIVTTTGSGSINPYYYELTQSGDVWVLMGLHPDNQTIVGSIVVRPASGTAYIQSNTNLVMTPQRVAYLVNFAALQSAYVAPGTPSRVTSQQGFTADQLQASYYTGSVASNDCVSSITIPQFLAQNGIDLGALISCMQNSGYNPLSCRTISNPLGGYIQLLNYYMMNGGTELHEVVVSGSTYTHDIYTSTGASSMSRIRHTFDWKAQGAPTTTTTAVAQSLSSRQGTLPNNGGVRKFAVLYYNNSDPAEPTIVIKVDETGTVSQGSDLGTNRCGTRKRSAEEEQPQTKIKVVEKRSVVNIEDFEARRTYADMFWDFFGFGPSIKLPHQDMKAEDWFQLQQYGPLVDGRLSEGFWFSDDTQEHDVYFKREGNIFEVTMYSRNISQGNPQNKKLILK